MEKRASEDRDDPPMRVIACFGHRYEIAQSDEPSVQARTRGKRLRPVAGDAVRAQALPGESDWLIEAILPRRNELARPDSRGRREILAANVDRMIVVTAPRPTPDWFIVDRYLAAARLMPCDAAIIWNKADLDDAPAELSSYADLGYPVMTTSTKQRVGIEALADLLGSDTGILVGQSGVGKSSLINGLIGSDAQRTGAVSTGSGEGRHTTVSATLVRSTDGYAVIDSPGVRDYAPSVSELRDVGAGFVEIQEAAERCRFANCQHRAEPGCAVKTAVADGDIAQRRYDSYLRLRHLTEQLSRRR